MRLRILSKSSFIIISFSYVEVVQVTEKTQTHEFLTE